MQQPHVMLNAQAAFALPAGVSLLAVKPDHSERPYLCTILCLWLKSFGEQYVTWTYNSSGTPGAGNGHYFDEYEPALQDFLRR